MATAARTIASLRFKIGALLAIRHAMRLSAAWCFVWGAAAILLAALSDIDRAVLLWGAIGLAPMAVAAIVLAWAKIPSESAIRALLDDRARCGGLLMAAGAGEIGQWSDRIGELREPSLHFDGGRTMLCLVAAVSFVLVSFLVPQRYITVQAANPLEIGEEIDRIAEKIETLAEEEIFDEEKAETILEKLRQAREEASGQDPVKTWEMLDHIEAAADNAAAEATESALQQTEQLAKAETLAQAINSVSGELPADLLAEAMADMAKLASDAALDQAALRDGDLASKLSKELAEALKNGTLSPEQLEALRRALQASKGGLASGIARLSRAQLIDPNSLRKCKMLGECKGGAIDPNALGDLLAFCAEGGNAAEGLLAMCNSPGRGGINRGRGDAPMTWAQESDAHGAKFKEQMLPPNAILSDSRFMGISTGSHDTTGQADTSPGALSKAGAGSGSAHAQTVLPRHRHAVRRYFDRTD